MLRDRAEYIVGFSTLRLRVLVLLLRLLPVVQLCLSSLWSPVGLVRSASLCPSQSILAVSPPCLSEFFAFMAWASMLRFSLLRPVRLVGDLWFSIDHRPAHFRSLLPMNYEWVFIDGPSECDAAPGVAAFYEPPYLCWYTTPTTAKMDSAQKLISSVMERDGPFDAVMGFSQVCADGNGWLGCI